MADIISLNALTQGEQQVYVDAAAAPKSFAYSDGEQTEQYLELVFGEEQDLTSNSAALQRRIIDWPTEYHLSPARANLLRPFNLDSVSRVLELGSGCGAMSRYLGELGKQVDGVEGSATRARLGKMRCRDLDNVRVINANYNDLEFPQQYYDLVLFVGVIEYASKFHPDAGSDREAAQRILTQARRLLRPGGVVLVAIENRLGLKYMLGAHEDHYGRRYVGIDGYRNSAGIATYSRKEWQGLASDAGFSELAFSYPFPDYKLPRVVMSDHYVQGNPNASNHLEGMLSRDYYAPVPRAVTETVCWQAAASGEFLGDLSNSFCVLAGNDPAAVAAIQDFDFCHGASSDRRGDFAVITRKPAGAEQVIKVPLAANRAAALQVDGVSQDLQPQAFLSGQLLSAQWLRDIIIYVRREEFEQALVAYYRFLGEAEQENRLYIDLLPINIIVDEHNRWQVFDQEWRVDWTFSKEFVLFRALLTFIVSNWVYLRDFLKWLELQTVRDFIEFGFHANRIHLSEHLPQFIEQENRFQRAIAADPDGIDVQALLDTTFDFSAANAGGESGQVYTTVWWRGSDQPFTEQQSATIELAPDPEISTRQFMLDNPVSIHALRLDPFDIRKPEGVGFFRVKGLRLVQRGQHSTTVLWEIDGEQEIAGGCKATSAAFESGGEQASATWFATSDFPKLEFELESPLELDPENDYVIEADIAITRTREYQLAWQHYLVRAVEGEKNAQRAELNLISMKDLAKKLERDTSNYQAELEAIKQSRPFLIGSRIVAVIERLKKIVRPGSAG